MVERLICPICGYESQSDKICPTCQEYLEKPETCDVCKSIVPKSEIVGYKHKVCNSCAETRNVEQMRKYLRESGLWEDFCLYWIADYNNSNNPTQDIKCLILRYVAEQLEFENDFYVKNMWMYIQENVDDYADWLCSYKSNSKKTDK